MKYKSSLQYLSNLPADHLQHGLGMGAHPSYSNIDLSGAESHQFFTVFHVSPRKYNEP